MCLEREMGLDYLEQTTVASLLKLHHVCVGVCMFGSVLLPFLMWKT